MPSRFKSAGTAPSGHASTSSSVSSPVGVGAAWAGMTVRIDGASSVVTSVAIRARITAHERYPFVPLLLDISISLPSVVRATPPRGKSHVDARGCYDGAVSGVDPAITGEPSEEP